MSPKTGSPGHPGLLGWLAAITRGGLFRPHPPPPAWPGVRQRIAQHLVQLRCVAHLHRIAALAACQRQKVEVRQLRALELVVRPKAEGRRKLLQRRIAPVLQDDEGDGQAQLRGAPQRLDGVHRRAIAQQADDLAARLCQCHAHGSRHGIAQPTAAHGVESLAVQDGQVGMHGGARARRLFHHDGMRVAHLGQGLHHVLHAHQRRGFGTRARCTQRWRGARGQCGRSRACQQVLHAQAHAAHGRGALRRPGRRAGVFDQLHQLRAGRHMRAVALHMVGEGRCAQRKHQVVPAQQRHDLLAHGGQHAHEQPVVLRKAAAPRHGGDPHRRVVPLGQGHHIVPCAIAVHRRTDHEDRALRRIERVADGAQHARLGPGLDAHGARRQRLAGLVPVVRRDGDQHRTARLLHGDVVGAGNGQRHVLRARGLDAPLHIGLGQLRGLAREQERVERQYGARLLPGRDHHRRAVLVRREDIAHGMAHARRRVQVHEGRVVRGLGIAVGHAHHHRLLQAQDVAKVLGEVEEQRQLGRARVAEDGVDAETA